MSLLPLAPRAAFFDIGYTLGVVTTIGGAKKLTAYSTSSALLSTFSKVLGLRTGIITNVPGDMTLQDVKTLLGEAGLLDLLDGNAIITNLAAKANKPNPEIYQYASRQLGLSPGQCLYMGDDPAEVNGALASGMVGVLKPVPTCAPMALVKGG